MYDKNKPLFRMLKNCEKLISSILEMISESMKDNFSCFSQPEKT